MILTLSNLAHGGTTVPLVVFVELKRMTLFSAIAAEPLVLDYPEGVMQDMEFADTRFIETQLIGWRNDEKIAESNTYIIFSEECYFRQDFPKLPTNEDPQLLGFLGMVPFEHKLSKVFQLQQGAAAVAISKNLYRPLVQVFDSHHYRVTLALPQFAINAELLKQAKPSEIVTKLGKTFDQLKLLSFVSEEEREKKIKSDQKIQSGLPQDKKQLIILSIVFGVLLIALLLVYRWSVTADPLPVVPAPTPISVPLPILEPTPTASAAASALEPTPAELAAASVQVLNGSGIPGQADQVRTALEAVGFKTITTGNNSGGTVSRASILFAENTSEQIRAIVIDAVKTVVTTEPIIQELNGTDGVLSVRIVTST